MRMEEDSKGNLNIGRTILGRGTYNRMLDFSSNLFFTNFQPFSMQIRLR